MGRADVIVVPRLGEGDGLRFALSQQFGVPVTHFAFFERSSGVWNVADISKSHRCPGLYTSAGRPITVLDVVIGDFDFVDAVGDCAAGSGHSCRRRGRPQWTKLPL